MKALQVIDGKLKLAETAVPSIKDEALVRVTRSGICNTDIEIVRGYAGFEGTIGHEFVGIVESAINEALIGKRVVGEINAGCGACELCKSGDPRHCPNRTVLGIHSRAGAHAEFLSLPEQNLIVVPESVPDDAAVFVEPLAAAYGITERVDIFPETKVAVIGDGKLGLLCAFALSLKSRNLILIGKHPEKLALAGSRGIETVVLENMGKLKREFDVVVEASGSESGFSTAVSLVRPRGSIVLKSTFHGLPTWPASTVVVDEITVVGSRCGRFTPALGLLAERKVKVNDMISDTFDLADGVAAMHAAEQKGVIKVILKM